MKDVVDITDTSSSDSLLLKMRMTKELGFDFSPASVIMDFGCGSGNRVHELRQFRRCGIDGHPVDHPVTFFAPCEQGSGSE